MDYLELLVGGVLGVLLGVPLGAFLRPIAVSIERRARRFWGQDPVLVHVERNPKIIWSGLPDWITFSMYIDDPQRLSGSPSPGRDGWLDYMYGINAVDAYQTTLKATIQAKVDAAVTIERVRVVSHRQIPLSKGVVITRGTGGADLTPRRFEIDLDGASEPLIAFFPEHGGQEIPPPSFVLAAGDVERFHIWAKTSWENHGSPTWHDGPSLWTYLPKGE